MNTTQQILDYAAPRRPGISLTAIAAYSGILICLLYLLFFHLAPDAPMHSTGVPTGTALLQKVDGIISTAAGGKPLEYHVAASPEEWKTNGTFFTAVYFNEVYHQYPEPVWIGDGTTILNYPIDIQRADRVPTDLWLHQHNVGSVVTLIPGDSSGPQIRIHPVP